MKIWVDADSCPVVIKDILFRAADRIPVEITLVANQYMKIPKSDYIKFVLVEPGFDEADREIVKRINADDLVITGDIPLAADVIQNGGQVLDPRGEVYTLENIKSRLEIRDFMETLRTGGIDTGGPRALSQSDRNRFAGSLDKILINAFPGK